jgi:hypothetical protein
MKMRFVGMAGVAAVVVLGGCGSSTPLSAEELIAQGDALCHAGQERFAAAQAQPPADAAEATAQTDSLIDSANTELEGLRDLEPPEELSESYGDYLDAKQEALDLIKDGRSAAEEKDSQRYGELQAKVADTAQERSKLAGEVGFKVCSKPQPAKTPAKKPAKKPAA